MLFRVVSFFPLFISNILNRQTSNTPNLQLMSNLSKIYNTTLSEYLFIHSKNRSQHGILSAYLHWYIYHFANITILSCNLDDVSSPNNMFLTCSVTPICPLFSSLSFNCNQKSFMSKHWRRNGQCPVYINYKRYTSGLV